jgi:transposase
MAGILFPGKPLSDPSELSNRLGPPQILAIDLGKYNSVACFNTSTNQSEFETIATHRWAFEQLLNQTQPDQIVIETSSITGWVYDFCQSLGDKVLVANSSAEAWRWKNVKRKTDKDEALKLAKLTALKQVSAVYVPVAERRQYRLLVKYRKTLVNRINRIQNHIRGRCCMIENRNRSRLKRVEIKH